MPQSLVKNYIHITFSTKNRLKSITTDIQNELFSYLGGTCRELDSDPIQIGGSSDHVHLLVNLSRKIPLMTLVEKVKSHSSGWIKTKGSPFQNFYWQRGYGGFSINPKQISMVQQYILNQEEHHKKLTFKEEYRKILTDYSIDFDERYVWD